MVRIRLRRVGSTHQPHYRVVVADKESPRDGRFIEIIGQYNPKTKPSTIIFDEDRVYHWLSNGAQPSESVVRLFNIVKLNDRFARFKAGEAKEGLLAEAEQVYKTRTQDPRTTHPAEPQKA